jgi:hypothetical protein
MNKLECSHKERLIFAHTMLILFARQNNLECFHQERLIFAHKGKKAKC